MAPARGLGFSADEEKDPTAKSVIISHSFWQNWFGEDPHALGSTLTVDGAPLTVVGIMPAGFHFIQDADLWLPLTREGPNTGSRGNHSWTAIARLKPGLALSQAQVEVEALALKGPPTPWPLDPE